MLTVANRLTIFFSLVFTIDFQVPSELSCSSLVNAPKARLLTELPLSGETPEEVILL